MSKQLGIVNADASSNLIRPVSAEPAPGVTTLELTLVSFARTVPDDFVGDRLDWSVKPFYIVSGRGPGYQRICPLARPVTILRC